MATDTIPAMCWQCADAMALPFADASFDAVACQFGAMLFTDKRRAFGEAHRVLAPGGTFVLSVWDRLAANPFVETVCASVAAQYPLDSPRFMERIPHGYHDMLAIRADLHAAGFGADARIDVVDAVSIAATARDVALAYCLGTPLREEIEARGGTSLDAPIDAVAAALAARFGAEHPVAPLRALLVEVERGA